MGEPYYRRKGDRIIIERKDNGKTIYIATLPPAKKMIEMLPSIKSKKIASKNPSLKKGKQDENFALYPLSEHLKEPTDEEIRRSLEEIETFK